MSEILFDDKNFIPDDKALAEKLGSTYNYWVEIQDFVKEKYEDTTEEWKFYGKKYGWQLKTFLKKRNLFFLIPYQSYFKIVFVFGDKAVTEIEDSDISEDLKSVVINAKKYAEGRGLPIDVNDETYISDIKNGPNIWVMSHDGKTEKQITEKGGFSPFWFPDGKTIIYVEENDIYRIDVSSREKRRLTYYFRSFYPLLAEVKIRKGIAE